jgi:hypothetical protein
VDRNRGRSKLRVLDLFCGLGGWSIGFHRAGFECVGLDLVDLGYPYELVLGDVRDLLVKPTNELHRVFGKPDVVVASPPCQWFSQARGRRPSEIEGSKGMVLVNAAIEVIWNKFQPRFWVLENVRGAVPFISRRLGSPRYVRASFYLWGRFPSVLVQEGYLGAVRFGKELSRSEVRWSPMKSWRAARLPLPLSLALAQGCRQAIEQATEISIA